MLLFYINSILMFYPKICFRKQDDINLIHPDWLHWVTMDLFGAEKANVLNKSREAKREKIAREVENARIIAEKKRLIESAALLEEQKAKRQEEDTKRQEQEAKQQEEEAEFHELVTEMSAQGFSHSRQVSNYIMRNKLGYKYKNISGVVTMEKEGRQWDFKGGFPPKIYARLCSELCLSDQGSTAIAVKFESFKKNGLEQY
jgi:hypothetical protein